MTSVNIEDFETDLARHLDNVANGEPLTIMREGEPFITVEAAKAVPQVPADTTRRFGFLDGKFTIPEDFDTYMQAEIIEMFEGRPDKFSDMPNLIANEKRT